MATIHVKRLELIKALEAKAKANQAAYDEKAAAVEAVTGNSLAKMVRELADKEFESGYNKAGSTSRTSFDANVHSYLFNPLGIKPTPMPPKPLLFEKQLTLLRLSTDDSLELTSSDDLITVLA